MSLQSAARVMNLQRKGLESRLSLFQAVLSQRVRFETKCTADRSASIFCSFNALSSKVQCFQICKRHQEKCISNPQFLVYNSNPQEPVHVIPNHLDTYNSVDSQSHSGGSISSAYFCKHLTNRDLIGDSFGSHFSVKAIHFGNPWDKNRKREMMPVFKWNIFRLLAPI